MDPSDALAMQVTSLRKVYGGMVTVDEVSFEVERGIIFGIIGPNGAGKTTAIECLEGLRHPDGGSVLVAGLDLIAEPRTVRPQDRRTATGCRHPAAPEGVGEGCYACSPRFTRRRFPCRSCPAETIAKVPRDGGAAGTGAESTGSQWAYLTQDFVYPNLYSGNSRR